MRGRCIGRAVLEDVVVHIRWIANERTLKPRVFGRCVFEKDGEHDVESRARTSQMSVSVFSIVPKPGAVAQ